MHLEDMYRKYAQDVYRFAFWLCGNPADAEDITSEVFLRAWLGKTIRVETVKAYLLHIARNCYRDQIRLRKSKAGLSHSIPGNRPGPAEVVESSRELSSVKEGLQQLSETDRVVLLMRAEGEVPYGDIARSLNISVSAAKVRVHRARIRLAGILKKNKKRRPTS